MPDFDRIQDLSAEGARDEARIAASRRAQRYAARKARQERAARQRSQFQQIEAQADSLLALLRGRDA